MACHFTYIYSITKSSCKAATFLSFLFGCLGSRDGCTVRVEAAMNVGVGHGVVALMCRVPGSSAVTGPVERCGIPCTPHSYLSPRLLPSNLTPFVGLSLQCSQNLGKALSSGVTLWAKATLLRSPFQQVFPVSFGNRNMAPYLVWDQPVCIFSV